MAFYIDAGATPIAELAKDRRFPWDHENECFQAKMFRGWGPGKVYWHTRVSRFMVEDVAGDLDSYLRYQMVHTCLELQAQEPNRATDPVTEDGNYAIEWRWVRDPGMVARSGTGWDLIGELVDVSLIDRLISDIRRTRGIAAIQKTDRIDRLIQEIEKEKQTAVHRKTVAKMFGVDPAAIGPLPGAGGSGGAIVPAEWQRAMLTNIGKITKVEIDENGVNYTAEITEKLAEKMRSDFDRSLVFGSKPVSLNGLNLNPGDTLKIAPKLTFNVLEEWRKAVLDSYVYGNSYIHNGRRVDPLTVRTIINPITSY